jgi:integrase
VQLFILAKALLGRRLAGKSPWIFPSGRKQGKHIGKLNNAHDAILEKAAADGIVLKFVIYDFRHTFATRAAQAGIDLASLAALLGHSSLRVVMKYVHPTAEHQKAAMEKYEEAQQVLAKQGESEQKTEWTQ